MSGGHGHLMAALAQTLLLLPAAADTGTKKQIQDYGNGI
jgi:hypothetical protein